MTKLDVTLADAAAKGWTIGEGHGFLYLVEDRKRRPITVTVAAHTGHRGRRFQYAYRTDLHPDVQGTVMRTVAELRKLLGLGKVAGIESDEQK